MMIMPDWARSYLRKQLQRLIGRHREREREREEGGHRKSKHGQLSYTNYLTVFKMK